MMLPNHSLPWSEKYRPKKLIEVTGQKEIIPLLIAFVEGKNMPNLLFSGPPGVGKTTSALAIAHELFKEDIGSNFLELNASDERGIEVVRGWIKDFARSVSIGKVPFKLIFLDEADALTQEAQQALRRTMEASSSATRFIISANYSSRIIEPIQSRCAVFRFNPLTESDIVGTLKKIAISENLKIDDEALKAIFYVSEGDMRKAVTILQSCAIQKNNINAELVHSVSSKATPKEIRELIDQALNGNFLAAREKLDSLLMNYGLNGEDILLQIYREIPKLNIDEKSKMQMVIYLGECNFRLISGANERIQLEALIAQIAARR